MSDYFLYLFKASLVQATVCGVYGCFLRKETFYRANRLFLLGGFLSSLLLPLVEIPAVGLPVEEYVQPASQSINAGYFWLLQQQASMQVARPAASFDWLLIIAYIYAGVVAVFVLRLLAQLWSINQVIRASQLKAEPNYTLAINAQVAVPFSFFRYVVLNAELYEAEAREHILKHEQIHVAQRHSWDILLTEILTALFWFNPFAWWLKSFSKLNLEYLADQGALQGGVSRKNYQFNLLKVSLGNHYNGLTNYFNQSLLKTRIQMMNRPNSVRLAMAKYLLILPLLAGLLFLFQTTQAEAMKEKVASFTDHWQQLTQSDNAAPALPLPEENPKVEETSLVKVVAPTQSAKRTIKGIIQDMDTGQSISGVYVWVRGQADGVMNDAKGRFSVEVQGSDETLVFMHADYDKAEMAIPRGAKDIKVVLKKTKGGLNDPLYLLDGKEISQSELSALDTQKIASIEVLKDSSSTSAYGGKGKNGVIKILTRSTDNPKQGDSGQLTDSVGRFRLNLSKNIEKEWKADPLKDGGDFNVRPGQLTIGHSAQPFFRMDSTSSKKMHPLYFIDGKKVDEKTVGKLNSNDIEAINVYKDAESIKPFGEEGKEGVVEIKLKPKKK